MYHTTRNRTATALPGGGEQALYRGFAYTILTRFGAGLGPKLGNKKIAKLILKFDVSNLLET